MTALEPYQGGKLARQTNRELDRLNQGATVQRARDEARAGLAAGRVADIGRLTRHGLNEAVQIGLDAQLAANVAPWAAQEFERIARAGTGAIKAQIDDLADGR